MLIQDLNTHTIDADVWEFIKYVLVLLVGIAIWQGKELISVVKEMLKKVTILEVNSNNTTDKVTKIEQQQEHLIKSNEHLHTRVETHEQDIHRIKKAVFKEETL